MGRKRKKDAVPSIEAFLLPPEDEPEESDRLLDFYKSRPLYSSPALLDHNYANFAAVVPEWVAIGDEKDEQNTEEDSDPEVARNDLDLEEKFEPQSEPVCGTACNEGTHSGSRIRASENENSFKLLRYNDKRVGNIMYRNDVGIPEPEYDVLTTSEHINKQSHKDGRI